jgi:hypothetical protein
MLLLVTYFPSLIALLALLMSVRPGDGMAEAGVPLKVPLNRGQTFGPNWGMGTMFSLSHIVEFRTIFYAGVPPTRTGRARRFAVWPGLATETDSFLMQAYAAVSEEDLFYKE